MLSGAISPKSNSTLSVFSTFQYTFLYVLSDDPPPGAQTAVRTAPSGQTSALPCLRRVHVARATAENAGVADFLHT